MSTWYRAGTITVVNGSTTVTGSGTAWVSAVNIGDAIVLPDGRPYEVTEIVSATSLRIATGYLGSGASGQPYAIIPTRGVTVEFNDNAVALLSLIQEYVDGVLAGRFPNGTAAAPSVSFAARTGTGLRLVPGGNAAAAALLVQINEVEKLRFNSAGAVLTGLLSGTAVTQSQTDETNGRLMKLRDFGLGALGSSLPTVTAKSQRLAAGFYTWSAGSDFAPGLQGGGAIRLDRSTDRGTWIAALNGGGLGVNEPLIYASGTSGSSGDYGPWRKLYHEGSILGTVSQSGGLPTGAVIERGSNANGEFVRFADGTQICWLVVNMGPRLAFGVGSYTDPYRTASSAWAFPAAFSVAPNYQGSAVVNTTTGARKTHTIVAQGVSASNVIGIQAISNSGDAIDIDVTGHFFAIGRWF